MVHNGIEYGDMQLICEAYHIMKDVLGMLYTNVTTGLRIVWWVCIWLSNSRNIAIDNMFSISSTNQSFVDSLLEQKTLIQPKYHH